MVFSVKNITNNFNAVTQHTPVLPKPERSDSDKPNNVIISLFDGVERYMGKVSAISWNLPDPKVYEAVSCSEGQGEMTCIIGTLRDHVTRFGTIDELDFIGHGAVLEMANRSGGTYIFLDDFLDELADLERDLGVRVCNRVVFHGCETFSNLNEQEISYLRGYADEHDMEIVGTTSKSASGYGFLCTGRYVQFTPDGNVIRDELDDRYAPLALLGASGGDWVINEISQNNLYQANKIMNLPKI